MTADGNDNIYANGDNDRQFMIAKVHSAISQMSQIC